VLFDGRLLALKKKFGGAKLSATHGADSRQNVQTVMPSHILKLLSIQLGVNTLGGCEAVVEAVADATRHRK
jgi:hypothetical protein